MTWTYRVSILYLHFENTQPNKTLAKTVDTEDIIGYKTIENKYTYKAMGSILRF